MKYPVIKISGSILLTILNVSSAAGAAQPLFTGESAAVEFSLEAPYKDLFSNRDEETEVPAVLRYSGDDGEDNIINLKVHHRGRSRLRNCRFPPLLLNFSKENTAGTLFEGQDKLKLATHCISSTRNRKYIAREYQVYRAFNLVTEYSLKVRWVTVTYIDSGTGGGSIREPGFLIEDDMAAGERLGMQAVEVESLTRDELDKPGTALMFLFQYLVGNIDWSALKGPPGDVCCHNFKVLTLPGQADGKVLLPYDFDQSNYVAADYAVHNQAHGIGLKDHPYKGYCEFNNELQTAAVRLEASHRDWIRMIETEPVDYPALQSQVRYLEKGFQVITDPEKLDRYIIRRCR